LGLGWWLKLTSRIPRKELSTLVESHTVSTKTR